MWIIPLVLPMPVLIWLCMRPLPKEFHRVNPLIGALLLLPCLIGSAFFTASYSGFTKVMLIFTALLCYFVIRGVAFLGMEASFKKFERERRVEMSFVGTMLVWAVTVLEPIATLTIAILAYTIGYPAKLLDVQSQPEVWQFELGILVAGVCLSYGVLVAMNENRKKVIKDIERRAAKTVPFGRSAAVKPPSKK